MRKALTKSQDLYHINDGGNKVDGTNPLMRGNCTGLSGDCTGLSGDLDDCDLTADERAAGFSVADLVGP